MAIGAGIELGSAVLRAAVVERRGSTLKLLAWQEVPCDTNSPESLTQSLAHLRRTLRLKHAVVLGMPASSVLLASVQPLIVDPRRATLAIQFELQQCLPFELGEAAWHYQWLHGASSSSPAVPAAEAPPRTAVAAAMKRSRLDERLACCRRAGITVRAVAVSPLAVVNAWRYDLGSVAPSSAVFLHLGEQQIEWIAWSPSQLRVLPIGGDPASQPIDALLQTVARSWEALDLSSMALLGSETGVWLFGANARIPGVEERLATILRVRVSRFDPSQIVRMESVRVEPAERSVVALGLALQGLGVAPIGVNLLAEGQQRLQSQQVRRGAWVIGGVCAAVALATAASGMVDVRQRHASVLALLTEWERTSQALRPEVRTLIRRQAHVERRTAQLRELVAGRVLLSRVLTQLAAAMPDDVWLSKLEVSKDGQVEGVLEGRAKSFQSVTQFMDRLKSVAHMTGVKPLATTVMIDEATGKELVSFSIVIERARDSDGSDP